MQSRTVKDLSKWQLNSVAFQNLCRFWLTPDIDLFASRVSRQVPACVSWNLDPYSKGRVFKYVGFTKKDMLFLLFLQYAKSCTKF